MTTDLATAWILDDLATDLTPGWYRRTLVRCSGAIAGAATVVVVRLLLGG